MKKHLRLYALLLTSFFLVGIMAAAAAAASVTASSVTYKGSARYTASGTLELKAEGNTTSVSLGGVRVGETASFTLDTAGYTATVVKGDTIVSGVAVNSSSLDITGAKAGTATIRLVKDNTSADITVTVKAADKPTFWASDSGVNLGELHDETDKAFFAGRELTSSDGYFDTEDKVKGFGVSFDVNGGGTLTATFSPAAKDLAFTPVDTDSPYELKGYLSGTMPSVKADTTFEMTLTAKDAAGNTSTKNYKFKVLGVPTGVDKLKNPSDITWGQAWAGYSQTVTNVDYWKIAISDDEGTALKSADGYILNEQGIGSCDLSITLDKKNTIELKLNGKTWEPGPANSYVFDSKDLQASVTKYIRLTAFRGTGDKAASVDKTIAIKFKNVAPYADGMASKYEFNWGVPIQSNDTNNYKVIAVKGPGATIDLDSKNGLPDGLEYKVSDDLTQYIKHVIIYGNPKVTTKAAGVKPSFVATNAVATKGAKIQPTVIVKTDRVSFDIMSNDLLPIGDVKIGDEVEVEIKAYPAPIKWEASNLPKGLTISVPDKNDTTTAVLKGKYTTASDLKLLLNGGNIVKSSDTAGKNQWYTIKATNTDYTKTAILGHDGKDAVSTDVSSYKVNGFKTSTGSTTATSYLRVWPELSFKTKDSKPIVVKADEKTSFTIEMLGYPLWSSDFTGWKPKSRDIALDTVSGDQMFKETPEGVSIDTGTSKMSLIALSKLLKDPNTITFSGSWDRVPEEDLTLTIKAINPVSTAEGEFTIKVQGTAPKFGTKELTLKSADADVYKHAKAKLAAGTAEIAMTAKIDSATAKKIFGSDADEITLTASYDQTSFLAFSADKKGNFEFILSPDASMSYTKLPVTVTALNDRVSTKEAASKIGVTVKGLDPKWVLSSDLSSFDVSIKSGDVVSNKTVKISVIGGDGGQTFGEKDVLFVLSGDGPVTITCKPALDTEKNGITPAYKAETKELTFTGSPTADKGDTVTKFSVSAKNNSTGKESKFTVEFTAMPKPEIDTSAKAEKSLKWKGIYGKKTKIAPKLTKKSKTVKWVIMGASDDKGWFVADKGYSMDTYYPTVPLATATKKLKDDYGLVFDSKKGTVTGVFKRATGASTEDEGTGKPFYIAIAASNDLTRSTPILAEVAVLGEKVKLVDKTVTVKITDDETAESKALNTNLSTGKTKRTDRTIASVDFAGDFSDSKAEAIANMSIVNKGDNTFAIKGKPSLVVKKATLPLVFTNYDTETKGKLSVVVNGSKPTIGAASGISVTGGGEETITLSLTNPTEVSEKIKWKIETKPATKGVSAKIKGNGTEAELTVKAANTVANGSATVVISATDSVTKEKSANATVTVSVTAAASEKPEVLDELGEKGELLTENETVAKEKALGEGTVKMGHERTVSGLTAAQRTFLEENGYVIAAVLPEIEVEDAEGQYEFEVDTLEEAAATGAELVWFAFADKPTEDDEIVDFFDVDAEENADPIKVIPESRKLIVAPWLNVGTKYAPVIAVKAAAGEAEAVTSDDVKAKAEEKTEEAEEETSGDVEVKAEVKEEAEASEKTEKAE